MIAKLGDSEMHMHALSLMKDPFLTREEMKCGEVNCTPHISEDVVPLRGALNFWRSPCSIRGQPSINWQRERCKRTMVRTKILRRGSITDQCCINLSWSPFDNYSMSLNNEELAHAKSLSRLWHSKTNCQRY